MTINTSSIASPATMNFAAASPAQAEKTLAGLLSKTFIADAALLVNSSFSAEVAADLTQLKTTLLSGESIMTISTAVASTFGFLAEAGVSSPYDTKAGKAVSGLITKKFENALYALLPTHTLSKSTFDADIAKLKSGLKSGHGFAELFHIF